MDTVTQIALGAAVGEAVAGRQVGKRAMVWGCICGLLPDLDSLFLVGDAVKAFTYHRGPSHSIIVLTALTPLLVWLILKLHPRTSGYRTRWYALVYLAFVTHVLLDCFTVYGTQIFWPLKTPPVMWSTIFPIDPVYSVPLICGILAALMMSRKTNRGHVINTVCLALSTLYLMWSVGAKLYATDFAQESLKRQGIGYHKVLTIAAPFNTLLWRVLVLDGRGYYEGFYSLFDKSKDIRFQYHSSDRRLLRDIADHWPVKRLQWFTHGFYAVKRLADDIVITDLRMGLEPYYAFSFKVGKMGNPHATRTKATQVRSEPDWTQLLWVWQRIWTNEPDMTLAK